MCIVVLLLLVEAVVFMINSSILSTASGSSSATNIDKTSKYEDFLSDLIEKYNYNQKTGYHSVQKQKQSPDKANIILGSIFNRSSYRINNKKK